MKHDPKRAGRLLAVGGAVLSAVLAVAALLRNTPDEDDEAQEEYTAPAAGHRGYSGYVPTGCRACGGPYPLCRMGCAAFDDD